MAKIAFGRFNNKESFVHNVDARIKLLMTIFLMVAIFFQFKVWSTTLVVSGILLLTFIIVMLIGKISFIEILKSIRSMWIFIFIIVLIYIFVPTTTHFYAFNLWGKNVYYDSFYQAGYIILRVILVISLMMILTATTKMMDLTNAFEWLFSPLKLIRVPVGIFAMSLSIAIRFIPTLLDESDRIMKAQASRGVDFYHGGVFKKFRAIVSLIIPLFISSFERSEELANAMEVRRYDPLGKRTRYHILRYSYRDLLYSFLCLLILSGVITLFVFDQNSENGINLINIIFNANIGF